MNYRKLLQEFDSHIMGCMECVNCVIDNLVDEKHIAASYLLGQMYEALSAKKHSINKRLEEIHGQENQENSEN